jgi:hypothetical protein
MGGIRKMAAAGWPTSKSCPDASVLTATAETAVLHPRSFGGFTVGDRVAFRQTGQREWFLEHITIREDGKLPPLAAVRRKPDRGQRRHTHLDDLIKLFTPS